MIKKVTSFLRLQHNRAATRFNLSTGDLFLYGNLVNDLDQDQKKFLVKYHFRPDLSKWEKMKGFYYLDEMETSQAYTIETMIKRTWRSVLSLSGVLCAVKDNKHLQQEIMSFVLAHEMNPEALNAPAKKRSKAKEVKKHA